MSDASVGTRARFTLRRVTAGDRTFADEIRAGLTAVQKSIPPRYFYDDLGSSLFEAITYLPEYYVTRAETELLRRHAHEIINAVGSVSRVVELGSGSGRKTRLLLDEIRGDIEYIPVDIDPHVLEKNGRELLSEYEALRVSAICSEFAPPSRALADALGDGRTLAIFLGSTIGNFEPRRAAALLRDLRNVLKPGDSFLLGADLKKSREMLEKAYNDALGVTEAFNLNLLQRINRDLGGHFDLRAFGHWAFYEPERGRVEMHLVSLREQSVKIDALNLEIAFSEGETIHTENSYKYDDDDVTRMVADSGFEIAGRWTDSRRWFADVLLRAR
ncbi:MAG TPA: L-histidine N(alpha)-methyltransferase [Thermoanaerobaculia bacterium]